MTKTCRLFWTTAGLMLAMAGPVQAQQDPAPAVTPEEQQVDFAADRLEYDNDADVVTAAGDVRMSREGNRVRADRIIWNRKSGEVRAEGNVQVVNPGGDTAYGDTVQLTDTLKDGVVENLLLVLADGGRLAARRGERKDGITTLENAAYSPCPVIDDDGCPKKPTWQISAVRIIHDPVKKRITFRRARFDLFGIPIAGLPTLSIPTGNEGASGFMVPDIQYTSTNGAELALPYYLKIAPNRDLTLTPHIFSAARPALDFTYQALTGTGAYRVRGFATYSGRLASTTTTGSAGADEFRGYIDASGRFQLDPEWSITGSIRRATDRTLLRRYNISFDDRLRSTIAAERVTTDSYFALTGWVVQTLRSTGVQGQIPVALPEIDFRHRLVDPLLGGRIQLQLNTIALGRTAGQDTQRAFAGARWDLRSLTRFGQEIIFTAYGRGDVYHSSQNALTTTAIYRGESGWQGRVIGAVAAEMRWPLIGSLMKGTQMLTPRLQIVASPPTTNLSIPNEDARSVDLEDSNLFALNRFPGYDRWEDGARITYGLDWTYNAPQISIAANIGQSYRLSSKATLIPNGTGLTDRMSDIVGRTTIKYRDLFKVTHRYRLDKDGFALRRNEIDAQVGNDRTYALLGYLRLKRNVNTAIEDLRDRQEIRLGGRFEFKRFWSVFGSATVDLTTKGDDPLSVSDGYQPVRHRLGIAYTDDCLDIGFTWRRDYDSAGDAKRGSSFLLRLAFRNLGR